MKKACFSLLGVVAMGSAIAIAQGPKSATYITDGKIVNGRRSPPESDVTKVLNGPSCSGMTVGADVVKKVVKTGDIIIIPAGVPHGWVEIGDHVDYLSFRPSARVLEAGYTNPALKK